MGLPGERQAAIRATLGGIADPHERLAVAAEWKTGMRPLGAEERIDANLVRGCLSPVWLCCGMEEGRCRFRTGSASPLVGGLVALLCGIYDGATPAEVVSEEPGVIEELGILRNLSPTRRNGLAAVRRALAQFAAGNV
jgi:cysteine desulfuration protein SufE